MLIEQIKQAGVVGAGGAGFPTHVKLDVKADCFIVNAAECEPLIETDKYLCRNYADELIDSALRVGEHLGAKRIVIALKGKYHKEIAALQTAIDNRQSNIEIFKMDTFYPSGDEQVIVQLVTGRSVPERGIPIAVGCVVDNVGTVLGIGDAVNGVPVTDKFLSVVGEVEKPVMLRAPLGASIAECIRAASPTVSEYDIILGGPMMGAVHCGKEKAESLYVTKTTGNIIVLPKDHYLVTRSQKTLANITRQAMTACLQCRLCTELCPRYQTGHRIRPHLIMRGIFREQLVDDNAEYERMYGDAANCSSCGLCEMYSCPMGLSPRKVNDYLKIRLREKGIDVPKNASPAARISILYGKAPTPRLEARLGLGKYSGLHTGDDCTVLIPEKVRISLSQHIGKPAVPVVNKGDIVIKGQLIASAAENALSANIHAGIDGVVEEITGADILIRGRGSDL